MNFLNQNIKYLRKEYKLTQDGLASKLEIKRSLIGSYEEGRAVPKIQVMQKLSDFFGINIDSLINNDLSKGHTPLQFEKGSKLRILSTVVDQEGDELVTLVPVKASAGYLNGYADTEFIESLPRFSMPFPELSKDRTYRVFQIKGDSMLPVPSGSYIFCEYIQDWTDIKDGKTHIIVTSDDGVVYKRAYNKLEQKRCLSLKSDNPEYPPYEVPVDSILEVWKALGYLSFDLPDASTVNFQNLSNVVMGLQKEVDLLKRKKP